MKTLSKKLSIPHLIDAERDLAYKTNVGTNSFFVIADVQTKEGKQFNILIHQLQIPAPPNVPQQYLSIFNVFDLEKDDFKSDEIVHTAEEVKFETDRFYLEMPNSLIYGNLHAMNASAKFDWGRVDLKLQFPGEVILNAGVGMFDFVGNMPTGQYSVVNGLVSGELNFRGKTYEIYGKTWFDRQWFWWHDIYGNTPEPMVGTFQEQEMYWSWMNLTLDNGVALGLWDIYLYGKRSSFVTTVQPDGSQLVANVKPLAESADDYWTSPTGQRYPTSWVVEIPDLDAKLVVKAIKKEQEVPSVLFPKYEGLADISGTYKGKPMTGYTLVEMVGNWSKDRKF